jgi:hypothetical protein
MEIKVRKEEKKEKEKKKKKKKKKELEGEAAAAVAFLCRRRRLPSSPSFFSFAGKKRKPTRSFFLSFLVFFLLCWPRV